MTWMLVVFYAALLVLAYFAMVGRTPTRRLFSAIGIIAVQIASLVWIQIIARALGSQSNHGSYSLESVSSTSPYAPSSYSTWQCASPLF